MVARPTQSAHGAVTSWSTGRTPPCCSLCSSAAFILSAAPLTASPASSRPSPWRLSSFTRSRNALLLPVIFFSASRWPSRLPERGSHRRGRLDWPPLVLGAGVICWVAGFDLIYATQDFEFDRREGLRSLVVTLGIERSLRLAQWLHLLMFAALLGFGFARRSVRSISRRCRSSRAALVYEHRSAQQLGSGRDQSRVFPEQRLRQRDLSPRGLRRRLALAISYTARAARSAARDARPQKASLAKPALWPGPVSSGISRSPIESTFASLCWRESRALSSFQQSAHRTPRTLFAAIASPLPEPPKTIPRSHSPRATASAAGLNKYRIIDRSPR